MTVDVKPELRESWIERRVNEGLDALVINAQLVETGLDYMELHQATRRRLFAVAGSNR